MKSREIGKSSKGTVQTDVCTYMHAFCRRMDDVVIIVRDERKEMLEL
jgi:hypothetical protein